MTKLKPKKRGPKETYTLAMADRIIAWISEGNTLREFCRQPGTPSWATVYNWQEKHPDFATRFARARDLGADAIAEESLAIIDQLPERADSDNGSRYDSAYVTWQNNRAYHRLKLLAKWNPKKYGEKLDLKHGGLPPAAPATIIIKTG